jgi:hypothetical protein
VTDDPFLPRYIKVTKIEAAQRQLDMALALWFVEGDPIPIHTLAFAAHEILHVICRRQGKQGLMFDNPVIKPEHRKDFDKFIKTDANFFKHAKDDFDSARDFNTTMSLSFMATSVFIGLIPLGQQLTEIESDFVFWARLHRPNWFTNDISHYSFPPDVVRDLASMRRKDFYKFLLDLRRQGREQA